MNNSNSIIENPEWKLKAWDELRQLIFKEPVPDSDMIQLGLLRFEMNHLEKRYRGELP